MLFFENDYSYGCHPEVLNRLVQTNMEPLTGYGQDAYSALAEQKIREYFNLPDARVFFLTGGTQTNQVVIDAVLQPFEAVISAETGHVTTHEAGAIEFTGHKVISLPAFQGKISGSSIDEYVEYLRSNNEYAQLVDPGAVYISYPTEYGTLYTYEELKLIREVCDRHALKLYIDGARLGYGLWSSADGMTPKVFASIPDVFYVGGTKVGALCGEAVVFRSGEVPSHFYARIKQHGAMLAKGRLASVQFDALFTDGLYERIGRETQEKTVLLCKMIEESGLPYYLKTQTNQQFLKLTSRQLKILKDEVRVSLWETLPDGMIVIRLCVSWATSEADILKLGTILKMLQGC